MRLFAGPLILACATAMSATTFTVTNTSDSGAGSLRQAILDANGNPGPDDIVFDIPGAGPHTIAPLSVLPTVTSPVVLDATTQPGYSGTPLVEIDGTGISSNLMVTAGSSTIRGFAINRGASGIALSNGGGNVVEANFIGTDPTGTQGLGNNYGIYLSNSDGNRIGGASAAERNVISANQTGIRILSSESNLVQGNFFGTTSDGGSPLGNIARAIQLDGGSHSCVLGGPAGEGNVLAASGGAGIYVTGSDGVSILGNRIGTDATGTLAFGNQYGIHGASGVDDLTIGGPGAGNVISGNQTGIILEAATGAVVQGNLIGTDASGTQPLGNTDAGMFLGSSSNSDNVIGGTGPGEGNLIAHNGAAGSSPAGISNGGQRNAIRGNAIHSNGGLGIDNGLQGVEENDPGDADTGANGLQNFPLLTSVELVGPQGGGSTRIQGLLHSAPSTTYDLDFYENPACTSFPREFLEGATYLGSGQVTTDGSGDGAFDVTLPVAVASGARISATATDPTGNTSEFSQRVIFSISPASGSTAGGTAVTLSGTDFDAAATVTVGGQPAGSVNVVSSTSITATTPAFAAGTSHDVVVANPDGTGGTLVKGWVADFLDVPGGHQFYSFVTTLVSNGITAGVGGGLYGVGDNTLRQQMAVFLLRGKYGLCYSPPPCTGVFGDVPCPSSFADWIEALAAEGITGGCGTGTYCPQSPVRRDQMAVFLLKTKFGSGHVPPPCTGVFPDVPCASPFAPWIEELADLGITGGCGGGNYCPSNNNTRGQMAVFITKTFSLQ
jgi:hypothetical protein